VDAGEFIFLLIVDYVFGIFSICGSGWSDLAGKFYFYGRDSSSLFQQFTLMECTLTSFSGIFLILFRNFFIGRGEFDII